MERILGDKWNVRVKNVNGDFQFVTEGMLNFGSLIGLLLRFYLY